MFYKDQISNKAFLLSRRKEMQIKDNRVGKCLMFLGEFSLVCTRFTLLDFLYPSFLKQTTATPLGTVIGNKGPFEIKVLQ